MATPAALADGFCADPSGNCPNGDLVNGQNPNPPTNVNMQNPNPPTNVNMQNPNPPTNVNGQNPNPPTNVNTQNPSPPTNTNTQNPSAGNSTAQNPSATNATIPAAPPQPCKFVLGFASLAGLIPQQVGGCTSTEAHNPANGDALQYTKDGLLVWRKLDNWTAFTDGYHTWLNGPKGLQERLNTQRFPWEGDAASYPAADSSSAAPTTSAQSSSPATSGFSISVSPSTAAIGAQVTVTGQGFTANGKGGLIYGINVVASGHLAVDMRPSGGALVKSNADGTFSATLTVPAGATQGAQQICANSGFSNAVCTSFTVQGSVLPAQPAASQGNQNPANQSGLPGSSYCWSCKVIDAGAGRLD